MIWTMASFGKWLRDQRKAVRMSQVTLAELATARGAAVTAGYISNLERDYYMTQDGLPTKPSEKIIAAIAQSLGVPIDEARLAAGYAPTNALRKPQNAAEFIEALEAIGVDGINLHGGINDLTPDEYAALLRDVAFAVEMNLRRAGQG